MDKDALANEAKKGLSKLKKLGLGNSRPWSEFFEVFKPPSNWKPETIERRLATNLLHYRANYAQLLVGSLSLATLLSRATIFALLLSAALAAYLFAFCTRHVIDLSGGHVLVLSPSNKAMILAVGSTLVFGISGALTWILWVLSLTLSVIVVHMLFRPRSVKSRYNAAKDDLRLRDAIASLTEPAPDEAGGGGGDDMEGGASAATDSRGLRQRMQ